MKGGRKKKKGNIPKWLGLLREESNSLLVELTAQIGINIKAGVPLPRGANKLRTVPKSHLKTNHSSPTLNTMNKNPTLQAACNAYLAVSITQGC